MGTPAQWRYNQAVHQSKQGTIEPAQRRQWNQEASESMPCANPYLSLCTAVMAQALADLTLSHRTAKRKSRTGHVELDQAELITSEARDYLQRRCHEEGDIWGEYLKLHGVGLLRKARMLHDVRSLGSTGHDYH